MSTNIKGGSPIHIDQITPTQDGYRFSPEEMQGMLEYVRSGGIFADPIKHKRPIVITRFEDGKLFIRDGFHRTTSIYLARPSKLIYPPEYEIENMTYDMWINANHHNGWYTPFDPRIEVRRADFFGFKNEVIELMKSRDPSEFILNNKSRYCVPRDDSHTFESLSKLWKIPSWGRQYEQTLS